MFKTLRSFDKRLWILSLGWFTSATGFALVIPFIAIFFHRQGMALTEIGLFFGLMAIVRATVQGFGGGLADRIGRYRIMVMAQLSRSINFILIASAMHYEWGIAWVCILIVINSILGAMFQPAANATVADLVGGSNRTEAYAITRAAGNLGWAVGPAIGGYMAATSMALLFLFSAAVTAISGSIILMFCQA